jgi:hypothetical protein
LLDAIRSHVLALPDLAKVRHRRRGDCRRSAALPSGAVDRNINGITYFVFGGAYYRPYYSGSSVFYEVVSSPA